MLKELSRYAYTKRDVAIAFIILSAPSRGNHTDASIGMIL